MKIVQRVSNCQACPNRVYGSGGVYECKAASNAPLRKNEAIPDWCPLPSDPAPIAANARRALDNAKEVVAVAITEAGNPNISVKRLQELLALTAEQLARG